MIAAGKSAAHATSKRHTQIEEDIFPNPQLPLRGVLSLVMAGMYYWGPDLARGAIQ
jgi:hypothetical protein